MTKGDRESLLKIARLRERVTKSGLAEAGAQLLVNFDRELDATYSFDQDAVWQEAYRVARQVAKEAQAKVQARSRELGIPDRFAPSVHTIWIGEGEQALRSRRNELRAMARRQVDALITNGKRKVEEISLDIQTRIITGGLSEDARAFLNDMPTPAQLMPKLNLAQLENELGVGNSWEERRLANRKDLEDL